MRLEEPQQYEAGRRWPQDIVARFYIKEMSPAELPLLAFHTKLR